MFTSYVNKSDNMCKYNYLFKKRTDEMVTAILITLWPTLVHEELNLIHFLNSIICILRTLMYTLGYVKVCLYVPFMIYENVKFLHTQLPFQLYFPYIQALVYYILFGIDIIPITHSKKTNSGYFRFINKSVEKWKVPVDSSDI